MKITRREALGRLLVGGAAIMTGGCSWGGSSQQTWPELAVSNAMIFTSDNQLPLAEAMAVQNGRISFIGSDNDLIKHLGPRTEVIDAGGRLILPGIIDSHCHVAWMAALFGLMTPEPYNVDNFQDLSNVVNQYAAANPNLPFIIAIGWKYEYIQGGLPTKEMADQILSDRPLFLWSYDGHTGWCNTMAVELMQEVNPEAFEQLTPEPDPQTGLPTGILLHFYPFSPFDFFSYEELGPEAKEAMLAAMTWVLEDSLKKGITGFNDVQIYKSFMPVLLDFLNRGAFDRVRLRGSFYIHHDAWKDLTQLGQDLVEWKQAVQYNTPHFVLGDSVKLYIEGVLGNRTALLLQPYADDPNEYGEALWTQDQFDSVIRLVNSQRLQACTHGIGDGGIRMIVNAYETVALEDGNWDSRHRVDHCELPIAEDRARMAALGVQAAMQPFHFFGDQTLETVLDFERLQRYMPWKSLEDAGVALSFGSDWCAGPINPLIGLLLAVTRMNYKGEFDWGPNEAIDIENAIRHYTIDSAKALKLEQDLGSLTVGKYGDFVIYDTDVTDPDNLTAALGDSTDPEDLPELVRMTVVGGQIVYERT